MPRRRPTLRSSQWRAQPRWQGNNEGMNCNNHNLLFVLHLQFCSVHICSLLKGNRTLFSYFQANLTAILLWFKQIWIFIFNNNYTWLGKSLRTNALIIFQPLNLGKPSIELLIKVKFGLFGRHQSVAPFSFLNRSLEDYSNMSKTPINYTSFIVTVL